MRERKIRAAVISDTHGLLRPEVEKILETCDVVIHGGDMDNPMLYYKLKTRWPLYAVRGNNDGAWAANLPGCLRFSLGGIHFCMVHDKRDVPKDLSGVEIVVFGHSHQYFLNEEDGRLWLNPGSCGYKRFNLPLSLVVLTLEDGKYRIESICLEGELPNPGWGKNSNESPEEKKSREEGKRKTEAAEWEKNLKFLTAKILRYKKRQVEVLWTAENLSTSPEYVTAVYRLSEEAPGITAGEVVERLRKESFPEFLV